MTVGVALFLIAVGAILRFAVTDSISGVDLSTVGVILMVVGVLGLLIALFYELSARQRREDTMSRDPRY
jgi:beta-lactamase regulating signal transducer with metallopeptidase domain